jgi:hypothetical protein
MSKEDRQALFVAIATEVGRQLFAARRDTIQGERRRIAGGWPGTLREARSAAESAVKYALGQRDLSPATGDELASAARVAYSEAQRNWLASLDYGDDDNS